MHLRRSGARDRNASRCEAADKVEAEEAARDAELSKECEAAVHRLKADKQTRGDAIQKYFQAQRSSATEGATRRAAAVGDLRRLATDAAAAARKRERQLKELGPQAQRARRSLWRPNVTFGA